MDSIKHYWRRWLWADATSRIITVNVIAWLVVAIGHMCMPSGYGPWWLGLFGVPGSVFELPQRIWTPASYMVAHYDLLHMMVNMLWLLLFGRLLGRAFSDGHVLGAYALSGLAGAACFVAVSMAAGAPTGLLLGASCAVLGVAGTVAVVMPKAEVSLLIIRTKAIWVIVAWVALVALMQEGLVQYAAHGAGFVAGLLYGLWLKRWDAGPAAAAAEYDARVAAGNAWRGSGGGSRPAYEPRRRNSERLSRAELERELDSLLDKVRASGYSSLTAAERQRLFDLSRQIKQ